MMPHFVPFRQLRHSCTSSWLAIRVVEMMDQWCYIRQYRSRMDQVWVMGGGDDRAIPEESVNMDSMSE